MRDNRDTSGDYLIRLLSFQGYTLYGLLLCELECCHSNYVLSLSFLKYFSKG
jgi:hypothetical protein